jgi:hypothetical protein
MIKAKINKFLINDRMKIYNSIKIATIMKDTYKVRSHGQSPHLVKMQGGVKII